jgi:hypothetical protein
VKGRPEHKCAIVVADELPTGLAVNAASVLSLTMPHGTYQQDGDRAAEASRSTPSARRRWPA